MNPPEAIGPGKKAPKPKPSRLETARSVIEQYAGDLRKIIKKLRQRPSLKMQAIGQNGGDDLTMRAPGSACPVLEVAQTSP